MHNGGCTTGVSQINDGMPTQQSPAATGRMRVVICDDGRLNRECLTLALGTCGIDAVGAGDLASLFASADVGPPDVALLNIGMPDSATLLQVGLDIGPDVRVIVTGLSEDRESDIVSCAEAGVAGLHLRTESFEELLSLIRNASDEPACSPAISAILVRRVHALLGQQNSEPRNPELTERESQILLLLEEGLSNQQIATRLHVAIHTVKNHLHTMFGKLGVGSRAEAVAVSRAMRYSDVGST